MSEAHDRGDEDLDLLADPWITSWEQQCIEQLEGEPDLEDQIRDEKDLAAQKLWLMFQNTATAIAQLYKDRQQGVSLWVPFQMAAGTVTNMYKESIEAQRRGADLGVQCGYQHRTKDLLAWAKKRRRHIRREDLIAFLAGKSTPPRQRASPRQRLVVDRAAINRLPGPQETTHQTEADLQTFREALALSSLSGAMSNVSVGYRPHAPSSPTLGSSHSRKKTSGLTDLNAFICDEFARHCDTRKRAAASPTDVIMDSPTHKRSRLV